MENVFDFDPITVWTPCLLDIPELSSSFIVNQNQWPWDPGMLTCASWGLGLRACPLGLSS